MGKNITNKGRKRLKLGTGEGPNYKPYIRAQESNPSGRRHRSFSGPLGRITHTLSDLEANYLADLLFKDNVMEVREQSYLELEDTMWIASHLGVKHPFNTKTREPWPITTDFLVITKDGRMHARTVKPSDKITKRVLEKFSIENAYYVDRDIDWSYVTEHDFNVARGKFLKECFFSYNLRIDGRFNDPDFYIDAIASLIQRLYEKKPLRIILNEFDSDYVLAPSSSMNLLKHMIVRKYIRINIDNGIALDKPMEITSTADVYALDLNEIFKLEEPENDR